MPNPEVDARPKRRSFTAAYKLRPVQEADRAEVTLGEICDVFRQELGVYKDPAFV